MNVVEYACLVELPLGLSSVVGARRVASVLDVLPRDPPGIRVARVASRKAASARRKSSFLGTSLLFRIIPVPA